MSTPDIGEHALLLGDFAREDLSECLGRITRAMRAVRQQTHWSASQLEPLKQARRELMPYVTKARDHALTQAEHTHVQALLHRYAALVG